MDDVAIGRIDHWKVIKTKDLRVESGDIDSVVNYNFIEISIQTTLSKNVTEQLPRYTIAWSFGLYLLVL